ncbi:FYVE, RhoGEF and PH domain-containing protein 6, partial [Toxocara canis]
HHCRACGNVVCASCSTHNYRIAGLGKRPVRVCDKCFTNFTLSGHQEGKGPSTEVSVVGNESSDSEDDEKNANYDHEVGVIFCFLGGARQRGVRS